VKHPPVQITLDHHTRNDPEALAALAWDISFHLRKELRPARLKELLRREPLAPLNDDTKVRAIAARIVEKIVESHWYVTRLPPQPPHSSNHYMSLKDK